MISCAVENPCSQKCTDTGVAVECSCHSGYELGDDEKTCYGKNGNSFYFGEMNEKFETFQMSMSALSELIIATFLLNIASTRLVILSALIVLEAHQSFNDRVNTDMCLKSKTLTLS